MKHTNAKSSQSGTSANPTTLNLQPRPFAPIQADSDQDNQIIDSVSIQTKLASSENLLAKLIATPIPETSNKPIRKKPFSSMRSQSMTIQAKLNIAEPNDKYEKEADNTAAKVVQQINSSPYEQSVQRAESMEEDKELQMKHEISTLQRQESTEEEDKELQMKSLVQRRENIGGGEVSSDLESTIQSARGSGQSLDSNLQAKMGQAMGADFSGVKVHTDSQSDQLNKSIQAKAFTTGQDVFFRQGAYEPSSRGGQELIAHELTHVVQQNAGVQRLVQREEYLDQRGVGEHYTDNRSTGGANNDERTKQRPDLLGAIGAVVTKLQQLHQEYKELQKKMGTGQATLQQVKEKFQQRAKTYEFLRLQDVNVDITGYLLPNSLDSRLVEYDDTPQKQKKTLVTISGGKLQRDNGTPVDTSGSVTFHTGKGWEIFVMSPTGELHMASHKIGKYHHSSLLAGGPTSAAGTIMATGGTLVKLNNKSGHYRPGEAQMRQALHALKKAGVSLNFDLEITGVFNGKAEDYMKPISAGGEGGLDTFEFEASKRILHHFIATKGASEVAKAFTNLGWVYTATSAGITIHKPDSSMATHEEVRTVLTTYFGEPGPVTVKRD